MAVQIAGPAQIRQVGPAHDPGVRASPEDFGSAIGSAIADLGQTVSGLGSQLQAQIQEPRDRVGLLKWKLDRNEALFNSFEDAKKTAPAGAKGFADGLRNRWQTESATTDWSTYGLSRKAQQQAQLDDLALQHDYAIKALTWERNEGVRQIGKDIESNVGRLVEGARTSGAYESAWADIEENLAASGGALSPEQEDIVRGAASRSLWLGIKERDPEQALEFLGRSADPTRSYTDKVVGVESGGKANAKNPRSSATGPGQFIESTWAQFIAERHPELLAQGDVQKWRSDRDLSDEAVAWYGEKNGALLEANGLPVTDGTRYLAHFAGPQGAISLLTADPNATAEDVLGPAVIKANPFLKGKTASEVVAWAEKKMGGETSVHPMFEAIPFDERVQLAKMAEAEIEKRRAKERGRLTDELNDYDAYLRSGNPDDGRYDEQLLRDTYGDEEGSALYKSLQDAEAYGADVNETKWASPEEIEALIAEREAGMQGPEGFRQKAQDLSGLETVIKERNTAIVNDPARYALEDPDLAADYEKMTATEDEAERRAATRDYVAASLAIQQKLGLPPEGQRILPKEAAQAIISQFKQQPEGGQNAAQLMQGLQAQWGKHWPQVFGELSKDLPGVVNVIGAMDRPGQEIAAEKLANLSLIGREELAKSFKTTDVSDLRDYVREEIADFGETFVYNGAAGATTMAAFEESANLLALGYMREGDTPASAAARARTDIIDKAYTMMGTFRVPLEHDADAISTNADRILQSISGGIKSDVTSVAGLTEAEIDAQYLAAVKRNGFWVTRPDEGGLDLYDETGRIVHTVTGEPETFTWQEILELGAEVSPTAKEPLPVAPVMPGMTDNYFAPVQ